MSNKILTAIAAAALLGSAGLASAQQNASDPSSANPICCGQTPAQSAGKIDSGNPFPVTGQSGAQSVGKIDSGNPFPVTGQSGAQSVGKSN